MKPVKIGIVGCGNISGIYMQRAKLFGSIMEISACADMVKERAQARAKEFGIPQVYSVKELLDDPEIELVINLTIPSAHAPVGMDILRAGKHLYNEKPLAVTREEGLMLLNEARKRGLYVGCAPDTVLGAAIQTCRALIDKGAIGKPVAATAFMMCHGHESWHPDPEFYYKRGGGPMFDMGPYYLSALVTLLGPASRVTGSATVSLPERTITSQPKNGTKISVETPTHLSTVINFQNGAVATMIMSFDIWAHSLPCIEIYGTEGTMAVPDPNGFGGQVRLKKPGDKDWTEYPLTHAYAGNTRSLGVADMAWAIRNQGVHRASGEVAMHVLDIMQAAHESSFEGRHISLSTTCVQPAPLAPELIEGCVVI
jgi:predicted dehydrogenase